MKQYCKRGHDTLVVGRTQRMCRECRRANDRARYQTAHRKQYDSRWHRLRWHAKGFLERINREADKALQEVEVRLGRR